MGSATASRRWPAWPTHLRAGGGSVLAPDLAHLVDADGTPATIEHVATAALASSRPGGLPMPRLCVRMRSRCPRGMDTVFELVYAELGVYTTSLGTPCDDM